MNDAQRQKADPHTSPAIQLDSVSLSYPTKSGALTVLDRLDLVIQAGEAVSLMGPSGAGKTSLLMLIAGLERPSGGLLRIAGHDLGLWDEDGLAALRGRQIGIVFQDYHLIPTMTALENVAVPLELAGVGGADQRAREALALVGLQAREDHRPSTLSGGEQQRVALARALAPRPAILLADEPTGNLDESTGTDIADLLFRLAKEQGTALFLVTHDPQLAGRCGRRLRLENGHLAEYGST